MAYCRVRPFRRVDLLILIASAVAGVGLAIATDREYVVTARHGKTRVSQATRLPDWIKLRRHDALRIENVASSIVTGLGVGVALVALRPRSRMWRLRPLGPGSTAALLTFFLALASAICWGVALKLTPRSPSWPLHPGEHLPCGVFVDFDSFWTRARPRITWTILGAWIALVATGRWRRRVDAADRLGLWIGGGWIVLGFWQAVIYIIVWY
jgi:hypothetical protein